MQLETDKDRQPGALAFSCMCVARAAREWGKRSVSGSARRRLFTMHRQGKAKDDTYHERILPNLSPPADTGQAFAAEGAAQLGVLINRQVAPRHLPRERVCGVTNE